MLLIGLVVFAWPTQWGGKTTYIVVRGTSMQPHFHTGDIVIARATDDHQVGDILVYAVPDGTTGAGKLIMHRLKEIRPDGTYVIQGDNRDTPDQFKIGPENVVGEERWHIPQIGIVMSLLSQWWLLAGLIGLFAFLKLWPDDETEATDDQAPALTGSTDEAAAAAVGDSAMVTIPDDAEPSSDGEHAVPERPPITVRRARPHVIVDGDGVAAARWPGVDLHTSRQWAVDAADEVAARFGTRVAVLFAPGADGLTDGSHAYVELTIEDATLATVARAFVTDRVAAGSTALVVTDAFEIADEVWSNGGSVMRCSNWLALGESVGAVVHAVDARRAVDA